MVEIECGVLMWGINVGYEYLMGVMSILRGVFNVGYWTEG